MDHASLLISNRVAEAFYRLDVIILMIGNLGDLPRICVVGEDVHATITV
ncbi:hypothetical protein BMS3Bbin04_01132 [bacterium BMS3Bbin04]|nr:hypothetical protein BMS3Bbin04_01132 [bacterium BMS3Bbin04]